MVFLFSIVNQEDIMVILWVVLLPYSSSSILSSGYCLYGTGFFSVFLVLCFFPISQKHVSKCIGYSLLHVCANACMGAQCNIHCHPAIFITMGSTLLILKHVFGKWKETSGNPLDSHQPRENPHRDLFSITSWRCEVPKLPVVLSGHFKINEQPPLSHITCNHTTNICLFIHVVFAP